MSLYPRLTLDLGRLRANAERMLTLCRRNGVDVMGVTKGVAGDLEVARVWVDCGVSSLGDARLDNLAVLDAADLGVPLWLLRAPSAAEASKCVALADGSLQTELATLRLVGDEALRLGTRHHVVLMVDLDTGREGLDPDEVEAVIGELSRLPGLQLDGLGVYFDFKSSTGDTREKLGALANLAGELAVPLPTLSGGASNVLALVADGTLPPAVNQLRLGTAPLLGLYSSHGPQSIPGWERDGALLDVEVIEVKRDGRHAILSMGHLDAPMEYLFPVAAGLELLRQSSDHTVVRSDDPLVVSQRVRFRLAYPALARLTACRYTRVEHVG